MAYISQSGTSVVHDIAPGAPVVKIPSHFDRNALKLGHFDTVHLEFWLWLTGPFDKVSPVLWDSCHSSFTAGAPSVAQTSTH